jgi:hypothetical protein
MPEYTEREARYARDIVEKLISGDVSRLELESDIAISDVQADAVAFSWELELLKRVNASVPAMEIEGEPVPVSLDFFLGLGPLLGGLFGRGSRWRDPYLQEWLAHRVEAALREDRLDGFTLMKREEARKTFLARVMDFLATRIAAVTRFRQTGPAGFGHPTSALSFQQILGGPRVTTPGCQFSVSTNSGGLRVFWSGAYRVSPNYFNSPTSPTSSVLQSGSFIFGVDGGAYGNNIQWDQNSVVTLPGLPYAHLNF